MKATIEVEIHTAGSHCGRGCSWLRTRRFGSIHICALFDEDPLEYDFDGDKPLGIARAAGCLEAVKGGDDDR